MTYRIVLWLATHTLKSQPQNTNQYTGLVWEGFRSHRYMFLLTFPWRYTNKIELN